MAVDTKWVWPAASPTGVEVLETPDDVQEELEKLYLERQIKSLDERLEFLHTRMMWLTAFQWGVYAIALISAGGLFMLWMTR
jgi:hypothetical protein